MEIIMLNPKITTPEILEKVIGLLKSVNAGNKLSFMRCDIFGDLCKVKVSNGKPLKINEVGAVGINDSEFMIAWKFIAAAQTLIPGVVYDKEKGIWLIPNYHDHIVFDLEKVKTFLKENTV